MSSSRPQHANDLRPLDTSSPNPEAAPRQNATREASSTPLTATSSQQNPFAFAHSTKPKRKDIGNATVHHHAEPLSWKHLIKKPVIRQWIYNGDLYKEKEERKANLFELFFDLAFVGIVHQLAEDTAERVFALNIAKFVILFYLSWSIWVDVRNFSGQSGTDDVVQRIYLIAIMLLLYGYSANASGIEIEHEAATEEEPSHYGFAPESHNQIQAAIAFYLIAKALRVGFFIGYAAYLPRFRLPLLLSALAMIVSSAIYFPLLFVTKAKAIIAIPVVGILAEISSRYILGAMGKVHFHSNKAVGVQKKRHMSQQICIPAISIDHLIERTVQFVVIVLGEIIINCTYRAVDPEIGAHSEYGRSALGILIAAMLIWLYFDQDSSRTFVHALRRHWITNVTYTLLHFPLCASLILLSAAIQRMVTENEISNGLHWYFSGGISTALACIAALGFLHYSIDHSGSGLLPRTVRLFLRLFVAIAFALLGLHNDATSIELLAIYAGTLVGLVVIETIGKLGAVRTQAAQMDDDPGIRMLDLDNDGDVDPLEQARARMNHLNLNIKSKKQRMWELNKHDLTEAEKGEEDVGIEGSLGNVQARPLKKSQRLAFAG